MAVIAPPQVVEAPPRLPMQYGLFSVLAPRSNDVRWYNGVVWEGINCSDQPPVGDPDCLPANVTGLPYTFSDGLADGEASSFSVYGDYKCSAVGNDLGFAQQKATEKLLAFEEYMAEVALWNGVATPNLMTGATIISGTFNTTWDALAAVEGALAAAYGSQGVIHLSRRVASLLMSKGSLDTKSGQLFTELGTPVVAGSGYGDTHIIGTSAMLAYRGEIMNPSSRTGDLLDRGQNTILGLAERQYLIGFEDCGHVAAPITTLA